MRKPFLEKNKLYMIEVKVSILLAYLFSYLVRKRAKWHQNEIARNQCFGKKVVIFNIKS
jgi:sugar phosphate permease